MYRYFNQINNNYISSWKSKGLSDENITAPSAPNKFLNPSLEYLGTKLKVRFSGSCLKQNAITYNHEKSVNIYIVYEITKTDNITSSDPTLENCLFGAVTITKNADINKYKYSGYGIGFDRRSSFSFPGGGFGQNVLIFGVDMSSSTKIDNKKKDILILGKGPTQGLEHTLTAEKMYSINFTKKHKKFCLSSHYNRQDSYLFVNGTEVYKTGFIKQGLMVMSMILVLIILLLQLLI